MERTHHLYHLAGFSPWPRRTLYGVLLIILGAGIYIYYAQFVLLFFGLVAFTACLGKWLWDATKEATYQGEHTRCIVDSLEIGFVMFLISEVLFFFSFFWVFFHTSLAPSIEVELIWSPATLAPLNPFVLPLINIGFLITASFTVTWAHYFMAEEKKWKASVTLGITVSLGLIVTSLQAYEYAQPPLGMIDSVHGGAFFVMMVLHGLHSFLGTFLLHACFYGGLSLRNII